MKGKGGKGGRATETVPAAAQAALRQALALHQSGRLEAARPLYRQALAAAPRWGEALHMAGVLELMAGDHAAAARLLGKAAPMLPADAGLQSNLGTALQKLGRAREALACHRRAVELEPSSHINHYNLGNALMEAGKDAEAAECFRRAVALHPDHVRSLNNLGLVLRASGDLAEAEENFRRALTIDPDFAAAHANLGSALAALDRREEALPHLRRAVALAPDQADNHFNLGNALSGDAAEASACFRRAVDLRPGWAAAHLALGRACFSLGSLEEAADHLARAAEHDPAMGAAHTDLGVVLHRLGALPEAVECHRRALRLRWNEGETCFRLAGLLLEVGQRAEAMEMLERALAADPGHAGALSQLYHSRQQICRWDDLAELEGRIRDLAARGTDDFVPFAMIAMGADLPLLQASARAMWRGLPPPASRTRLPAEGRRLRLGYLSADFREHPVAHMIQGLISCHDRRRFEVIGYSIGRDDGGPMRRRLEQRFDRFVDLLHLDDRAAAARIADDGIDILVDLMGHTLDSRPGILAARPALVQVNYFGFPAGMGSACLDYILADRVVIPPEHEQWYDEKVARLPFCFMPFDGERRAAHRPTRSDCGLPEEAFVFCAFHAAYKITPAVFDVWMRLLTALPHAVLWLLTPSDEARANLLREAAARGVEADRLIFAARVPPAEHLARLALADLYLDVTPYNAHTTAAEALGMGLPVLTTLGRIYAARVAASLLGAVGLSELIAGDLAEYEFLARDLARDPARMSALRARLTAVRETSPPFDVERLTRNAEAAFLRMAEIAGAGEGPRSFDLEPAP